MSFNILSNGAMPEDPHSPIVFSSYVTILNKSIIRPSKLIITISRIIT